MQATGHLIVVLKQSQEIVNIYVNSVVLNLLQLKG